MTLAERLKRRKQAVIFMRYHKLVSLITEALVENLFVPNNLSMTYVYGPVHAQFRIEEIISQAIEHFAKEGFSVSYNDKEGTFTFEVK